MADLAILIPHKSDPANDQALRIALDCIAANTRHQYELLVDGTTPANPYAVLNNLAARARADWIVFLNSDTFVAPDWDLDLLANVAPHRLTCLTLVEPYAIGVWPGNIVRDYGMRPDTFDRAAFEAFAASGPQLPTGTPFYYYLAMSRRDFLADGGFDLALGAFPEPLDIHYWNKWLKRGREIVRARSLIYHLQNYSNPTEQQKAVRWQPRPNSV